MFWESVQHGLGVLLHWQVYIAILEFLTIMLLPRILLGALMVRQPGTAAIGCLLPLVMVFVQIIAVVVFVLTVAPLVFGRTDGAAWAFPWTFMTSSTWLFVKLVLISSVVGLVLSLIRLDLFANAVVGCFVLAFVAVNIAHQYSAPTPTIWPGFWFAVGILAISAILLYLGLLLAAGVAALFGETGAAIGQMVGHGLAAVLMFLPAFIYGGWLLQQMR